VFRLFFPFVLALLSSTHWYIWCETLLLNHCFSFLRQSYAPLSPKDLLCPFDSSMVDFPFVWPHCDMEGIERIKTLIIKLEEKNESIKREASEVRRQVGNLFIRNSRLSRSLQDGFNRNMTLEMKISILKSVEMNNSVYKITLENIRMDIKNLKNEVISIISDFQSDIHTAFQISQTLFNHIQSPSRNGSSEQTQDITTPISDSTYSISETMSASHFLSMDDMDNLKYQASIMAMLFKEEELWRMYELSMFSQAE
jgi:FtsZ-binding cell division protein ZapB